MATPSNQKWETNVIDGVYHNTLREQYAGNLLAMEASQIGKKKHGIMQKWYPSGTLKRISEQNMDKQHGIFERQYHNGQLRVKGNFIEGVRTNHWIWQTMDGMVDFEKDY